MQDGAQPAGRVAAFFSGTTVWVVAIVAGVVLIVAGVLFYLWYRRRKSPAASAAKPAAPAPSVAKGSLADLWRAFLDKIPEAARHYPVYIVLGEAGAGKSTLIDAHVDWKGQAAQFFPSDVQSQKMQLYMGPDVLVQEISAPLLHDTSEDAKAAFQELWSLLGAQRPTVVVALDATALLAGPPDAVKELAQLVRGKVNILSALRGAPVRVRLCLTHLDAIPGYTQVARVLRARGATDPLPIGADTSGAGLARSLEPLEACLTYSLVTEPTDDFKATVRFFGAARGVFDVLSPFVRALAEPDDLSKAPLVGPLYLGALSPSDAVGDPFAINRELIAADVKRAESKLRTWCLAALVFVAVVTAGLYGYQIHELREAEEAVDRFVKAAAGTPAATSAADLNAAERAAGERMARLAQAEKLPLFRYSFADDKRVLRKSFTDTIRAAYLLPLLDGRLDASRLAYAVGLVYAAQGDDLGALVMQDPALWAEMLGVPSSVPLDYVKSSPVPYPDVVTARPSTASTTPAAETDLKVWYTYLSKLQAAFRSEEISPGELGTLQKEAGPLVEVLRDARSFPTTQATIAILSRDKRLDVASMFGSLGTDSTAPTWVTRNQDTLSGLLALVLDARLEPVQVDSLSLQQLLTLLPPAPSPPQPPAPSAPASAAPSAQASASASTAASAAPSAAAAPSTSSAAPAAAAPVTPPTYTLVLSETTFVFASGAWSDLLVRSRSGQLVGAFIDSNRQQGRYPFFAGDPSTYLPVGAAAVPGKGPTRAVQGIYTRAAFDAEMKPVLLGFDEAVEGAALGATRKRTLTEYVSQESARYASAYGAALRSYYSSYQLDEPSPEALAYDIGQLSLPTSWFGSFIGTVATNATLDLTAGNPYLQPLATSVAVFQPVVTAYGQLDKYAAILAKMLPPAPAPPPPGQPSTLADRLSPTGTAALAMVKKDPTSTLLLLQPWLDSVGLTGEWSGPFLKPVYIAYGFGLSNISQVVADAWKNEVYPDAQPLLAQFPFDPKASVEAAPDDMETRIGPNGQLWSDFDRLILPVCLVSSSGVYIPISSAIRLPAGMLDTVNALTKTRSALWDKNGKAQPLSLSVQALPFPAPKQGDPAVTLSQLQTGELSVFGFNQTPAWQPLPLSWSKQGTSSINVQISVPDSTQRQMQSTPPATSTWSFYRLLLQADPPQQLVWTWHLPIDATGKKTSAVSFAFASDPWGPFVVPAAR